LIYDQTALERCAEAKLGPNDFKTLRGTRNGRLRWVVAERALNHYEKYQAPIGAQLRTDVLQYAEGIGMGASHIGELTEYLKYIKKLPRWPAESVLEKVPYFKAPRLRSFALEELNEEHVENRVIHRSTLIVRSHAPPARDRTNPTARRGASRSELRSRPHLTQSRPR